MTRRAILIVEDDFLLGYDLQEILANAGIPTIGPAATPDEAIALIIRNAPRAALVDCNLNGRSAEPVARLLLDRSVPFIFVSGYDRDALPRGFETVPLVRKPYQAASLLAAATAMLGE